MRRSKSVLADQHLYLRLVIMIVALTGNLEATLRQICFQMALLIVFALLDLSVYPKLLRALRKILPFVAGYWLFATLMRTPFPAMMLFTLKLVYFVQVTVYVLSHLDTAKLLRDTARMRRFRWGNAVIYYLLATMLFLKANARVFSSFQLRGKSKPGEVLDAVVEGARENFAKASSIDTIINQELSDAKPSGFTGADVLGICLLALMVMVNSI
jgi:hypothetical protein